MRQLRPSLRIQSALIATGSSASHGLIDYFDEVVALTLYEFTRMPDDKKDRLWRTLAIDWRPTRFIVLVSDENVFHLPQYLNEIARLRAP